MVMKWNRTGNRIGASGGFASRQGGTSADESEAGAVFSKLLSKRSTAAGSIPLAAVLTVINFHGRIRTGDLASPAIYVTFGLFLIATTIGLVGIARKWR